MGRSGKYSRSTNGKGAAVGLAIASREKMPCFHGPTDIADVVTPQWMMSIKDRKVLSLMANKEPDPLNLFK